MDPSIESPVSKESNAVNDPENYGVDFVEVLEVDNLTTLSLAETALQDAGIEYVTTGQRLYAAGFPVNRAVGIRVSRSDEARAREALAYLEESVEIPPAC